jgi:hypothetical protein
MTNEAFVLQDAIDFIYQHNTKNTSKGIESSLPNEVYYPNLSSKSRVLVKVDPLNFTSRSTIVHRSGWRYVTDHIANLDSSGFLKQNGLILDTYLDRTFHWGFDALMLSGMLPYTSPWIGILHHTFDTTHSNYNNVTLFANPVFLQSLSTCQGIVVMSNYLAKQLKEALDRKGFRDVPVHVIYHPTEFVNMNKMFTLSRMMKNPVRQVVQVGAWLRNPYSIFELPLPEYLNTILFTKAALKGKNMDGYYVTDGDIEKIAAAVKNVGAAPTYTCGGLQDRSPLATQNKYITGMTKTVINNHKSVTVYEDLDNDAYDYLLTRNIVFMDLVDCSASNAIIECVVRNTIVIVNRHPALEEVLGENYPGFYTSLVQAAMIIGDINKLKDCYIHISRLDKSKLRIQTFMKELTHILETAAGK